MYEEFKGILLKAGELMLSMADAAVHDKGGHANFVTDADTAVQSYLMEEFGKRLPGAVFFAEEKEENHLGPEYTFIIDPIDGTTNFFHHCRSSAISVGLLHKGEPVLGMVLNPYTNELFHAEKGKGAFCNDTPIHVSERKFSLGLVNMGASPYYPEAAEKTMRAGKLFLARCCDLRRSGSAALDLCSVAAGRTEMFYEFRLSPWDYAAATFIIREAGGDFGSFDGETFTYEHAIPLWASSAVCRDEFVQSLDEVCRE